MRRIILFISMLLMSLFNAVYAQAPMNLTCAKYATVNYYESGEFEKDVDLVVQDAEKYMHRRIEENKLMSHPRKLAIVLDIDDTSLSNYQNYKKRDFSHTMDAFEESFRKADAPAIQPVLRLYNEAIKNGVSVFFITYRPENYRSYTITNLHKSGYYDWSGLYLLTQESKNLPAEKYKTSVRQMLYKKGYDIILSVGDQDSDLSGGYAEHVNKIPNPLYTTVNTECMSCRL